MQSSTIFKSGIRKVVILAGGQGKRLRPLTFAIPKPLIPIRGKPILEILLGKLRDENIKEVYLAAGYRSELLKLYFQDGKKYGVKITYLIEKKILGTAGPLGHLKGIIKEPFLMINGDILTKINLKKFYQFHRKNKAILSIAIRPYRLKIPYGVILTDGEQIRGIQEKPSKVFQISAGIYICEPDILDLVPKSRKLDMPDLIRKILAAKGKVAAFKFKEEWKAVDRMVDYEWVLKHWVV